jgi:hypothetical protein
MPEKVNLSWLIVKVSGLLSLFTSAVLLALAIYSLVALKPGSEIEKLAGADFLVNRGLVVAAAVLIFGLFELKTSSGIINRKRWSWISALLSSIVLILIVPLGTIFGLKLLTSLLSSEVKGWFGWEKVKPAPPPAQPLETRVGIDLELLREEETEENKKKFPG